MRFYYESNACWGWVDTPEDLVEKCKLQCDPNYGIFETVDDFLDRSLENPIKSEYKDFGTRREHDGNMTLREYLIKINELDNFLKAWAERS